MNKYDLLLLDLDGTTINTDELIVQAMFYFYDKYRDGQRKTREEIYYFSGPPINETFEKEFPEQDSGILKEEFIRVTSNMYGKYATVYPYCREELEKFKNDGIKLVVVTSKMHSSSEIAIKAVGLGDLLIDIIAYDDVINPKPSGEGCLKAMELAGIKDKTKVLYIGDGIYDILAANDAGIDFCLADWGPRKLNLSLKPKYKINSFLELGDIIYE